MGVVVPLLEGIADGFLITDLQRRLVYLGSRLRSKIGVDPSLPSLIITHRGVGYSFSPGGA